MAVTVSSHHGQSNCAQDFLWPFSEKDSCEKRVEGIRVVRRVGDEQSRRYAHTYSPLFSNKTEADKATTHIEFSTTKERKGVLVPRSTFRGETRSQAYTSNSLSLQQNRGIMVTQGLELYPHPQNQPTASPSDGKNSRNCLCLPGFLTTSKRHGLFMAGSSTNRHSNKI